MDRDLADHLLELPEDSVFTVVACSVQGEDRDLADRLPDLGDGFLDQLTTFLQKRHLIHC